MIYPLAEDLVSAVLPGECRVCGCALAGATAVPVCEECRAGLVSQEETSVGALCACCGEALGMESARFAEGFGPAEGVRCAPCRRVPPMFERAVAFGVYEGGLKRMLHLLKYERMRPLADVLGPRLVDAILGLGERTHPGRRGLAPGHHGELLVTAVPLFASKERGRGYNQSDVLAKAALRSLRERVPEWRMEYVPGLLERRRETKTQASLSPRGRRRNLQGAFAVRESGFRAGSEVLLIDDIYTTGATARECARVLRRGGASMVWVATLARAQKPQVALWDAEASLEVVGFG